MHHFYSLSGPWTEKIYGCMNDEVLQLFKNECRIPESSDKNEKNITQPIMLSQLLFGFPISAVNLLARSCSVLFDSRPCTNLAGHFVVRAVSSRLTHHCEENTVSVSASSPLPQPGLGPSDGTTCLPDVVREISSFPISLSLPLTKYPKLQN